MVKTTRLKWLTVGAACVALVAACSAPQSSSVGDPVESPTGQQTPTSTAVPSGADKATASQIKAANLEPCPSSDKSTQPASRGLPDITLPCLGEGPEVDLAGVRGRPMVVNVWASWCGPCRAELPILGQMSERTKGKLDFLGINVSDTRKAALEMAGTYKMRFPSVFDPAFETRPGLRVSGVPLTLFVRADGSIAYRHDGPITSEEQLNQLVHTSLGVEL